MSRTNTIRSLSLAAILAVGFLVLWAAAPRKTAKASNTPCKESMEGCCQKEGNSNKMSWETLPHQFFSTLSLD